MSAAARSRSVFGITRWAIAWFVAATAIAMALYPGGTYLHRSTDGYSFFGNFLSDLGMLVAWGGQPNQVGAAFFIVSELVLALTLVLFLKTLVGVYSPGPPRKLARAAAITGLVCCAAFIGAALLPADRFLAAHIQAAILAFRASMVSFVLFTLATARDVRFSRTAAAAWDGAHRPDDGLRRSDRVGTAAEDTVRLDVPGRGTENCHYGSARRRCPSER